MNESFDVQLADFGFSTFLKGVKGHGKFIGTPGHQPPEQLAGEKFSGRQSDLFASAVCLFTMVTQQMPFHEAAADDDYYKLIIDDNQNKYWSIFDPANQLSDDLKDLLINMLQEDPSSRLTPEEIFAHPWVNGPVPTE